MNYVITGPESTGKTTLSQLLAKHFGLTFTTEYAREFLERLGRNYVYSDLLTIAKEQFRRQEEAKKTGNENCFDTDLLTIKIWSEVKFGQCDPWIHNHLLANKDFLYVLCYPDFPWQPDPLRENPENQLELFELYKAQIEKLNLTYIVVKGSLRERLEAVTSLYTQ
jgi:nicotinamide riboside kinase